MKMFAILLLLLSISILADAQNCKYDKNGIEDPPFVWSTITFPPKTVTKIKGKIVDSSGDAVFGTTISLHRITSVGKRFIGSFETDYDGKFCFGRLKKGKYYLKIGNKNFQKIENEINLEPSNRKALKTLMFKLEIGY
jgi:hypothetical protein